MSEFTMTIFDHALTMQVHHKQERRTIVSYTLKTPDGRTMFEGNGYSPSPMMQPLSTDSAMELLSFLTLRPGDTDDEYFDNYSEEQLEWLKGIIVDDLSMVINDHEVGNDTSWADITVTPSPTE